MKLYIDSSGKYGIDFIADYYRCPVYSNLLLENQIAQTEECTDLIEIKTTD